MAKKKKNRLLKILLAVVVVCIVFAIIGKRAGWFGNGAESKVAVTEVAKKDIIETVTANGKIQPETEVKISPDVSGEIIEMDIREGDKVKEGEFLLKIKPDIYESNLERAEAALNSAKANLANAKARLSQVKAQFKQTKLNYQRNKQLYEDGAISEAEFENSEASNEMGQADVNAAEESVNAAEFSVLSSRATVSEARENLRKTAVYAPMSGTISKLNVEAGERVVGTEMMAGTEMLRIANLELMEVTVDVNENDIIKVSMADTAIIEVDPYLNREFKGVVTEIANSATTTGMAADQVTNFEVKIRILSESYADLMEEGDASPFRPGMSATVDIRTKMVHNVPAVPIQSVTVRVDSAKTDIPVTEKKPDDEEASKTELPMKEVVFVYEDGKVYQKDVKTGIQDDRYIYIKEGLAEGLEVVSAPYNLISRTLRDDMEVTKVSETELFKSDKK